MATKDCTQIKADIDNYTSYVNQFEKLSLSGNETYKSQLETFKQRLSDAKKEYESKGCEAELLGLKFQDTKNVIAEYSALDQARIDAETTYQKNKKIFLGVMVLLVGLFIVASKKSE
jgi:hypothetical protein